ncbi:unnamed protein product [Periconia digitata]|uniref:Uncharacterized protein n=1 Tax=Periconia digitata TaxID=1303443 RepID=A0A9W4UXY0_9PLEO|nr:unnamed protein product [Periconia digitata]
MPFTRYNPHFHHSLGGQRRAPCLAVFCWLRCAVLAVDDSARVDDDEKKTLVDTLFFVSCLACLCAAHASIHPVTKCFTPLTPTHSLTHSLTSQRTNKYQNAPRSRYPRPAVAARSNNSGDLSAVFLNAMRAMCHALRRAIDLPRHTIPQFSQSKEKKKMFFF